MTDPAYAPGLGGESRPDRLPRPARNAAYVMVAQTAAKLTTFAWTVVAARELTQGDFGLLNLALSIAMILASVAEWGFDPVLTQRTARQPQHAEKYFAQAIGWEGGVATMLFGVAAAIVAVQADGATRVVVLLVLLATYLDVYSDTVRALGTALQRQGIPSLALIVQRFATVLFGVPVLLLGGGLEGFAIAFLAGYALGFAAHLVALNRLGVRFRPSLIDATGMRRFLANTTTIGVSGLAFAALFRIDAIILESIKGAVALGAYSAAYRLFETCLFITFAVNGALFPLMSERGDDGARVRDVLQKAVGVILLVYVPYALVCGLAADFVLDVLFGNEYAESSTTALQLLATAPIVYAIAFVSSSALIATRRTGGLVVASVTALVINVGMNLTLIPDLSLDGAALTTTASYLAASVILLWFVTRVTGAAPALLRSSAPALAGAGPMAIVLVLAPFPELAAIGLSLAAYVCTWWFVARRLAPWQGELLRIVAARVGLRRD